MEAIQAILRNIKVGGKQSHQNMTLFPLLASDAGEPDYLVLEEALGQGAVEITEVGSGGSVPDLKLINKSPLKVLVIDGEELVGAKQNRIVNATFLIGGQTEIIIPVSCVEHGRWSYRSQKFASGKKVMSAMLRHMNQRSVAVNLGEGTGFRSDQGMIWNELAEKAERMNAPSPTGAMADLFENQKDHLGEYLKAFRAVDCQVGAAFAIHGEVAGLECFGHRQTFGKFLSKLVQSYALDALDRADDSGKTRQAGSESIKGLLERLRTASTQSRPSLGLGEDIRLEGDSASGASLVYEGKVLHLSAFLTNGKRNDNNRVPFQRFSERRSRSQGGF